MSDTQQGTLRWSIGKDKKRTWNIGWTSKRGKAQTTPPRDGTLAPDLLTATDNDIAVDYELSPDGSYPIQIRRTGTAWTGARPAAPAARDHAAQAVRPGGAIASARE